MSKWLPPLAGAAATGLALLWAVYMIHSSPWDYHCYTLPCSGTGCAAMVSCQFRPQAYLWLLVPLAVAIGSATLITFLQTHRKAKP